ncbi:MAG TPA: VWA domain-containing protein [Spirochaetia bacterium]|nr:VWA domain-containing protein [Spirochaetia bacterium]
MNQWLHFSNIEMLHLFWLIPAIGLLFIIAGRRARQGLDRITCLQDKLSTLDRRRRNWRRVLFLLALVFIMVALTRPAWNPEPVVVHQEGRDVVFVVDVSRSMLAEDIAPNRLERAKLAILDTLSVLDGNRVAVVAFAGSAGMVCPLTRDYGFFRWAVEGLSPGSVDLEGTLIGDAIRKVAGDIFDPREKRYKDLILITDGEDQNSYPVEAATVAGQQGVRIIAIGIGDDTGGSRIPVTDSAGKRTFLTYQGGEVVSRMQPETLRQIALATPGGRYLNAATGAFNLDGIYKQLITSEKGRDLGPMEITRYQEKFQIFLAAAFMLLAAEMLLGEERRKAGGGRE